MPEGNALLDAVVRELAASGLDPTRWVLSWARLLPSLLLIPAFGLQSFPVVFRVGFAFMLAAVVAPTLPLVDVPPGPLVGVLASELARGVPAALSVAICIWGATMAGNLIDELRGGRTPPRPLLGMSPPMSPIGILLSLAACVAFFRLGGPARLAEALGSAPPLGQQDLRGLGLALAHGVQFAVVLAGPLLALVPFVELLHALVARGTQPLATSAVFGPLKSVALLGLVVLLLDRLATGVVLWIDAGLPRGPS